jgi:hypothetical protein
LFGPRDGVVFEAEARLWGERTAEGIALRCHRDADLDLRVDPGLRQLLARLFDVPPVGHEQRSFRCQEEHTGRSRETGEVANVGALRDKERVDPAFVETTTQARHPAGNVERCKVHGFSCRSAAAASIARR